MDNLLAISVIIGIVNGISLLDLPLTPFVKFVIAVVLGLFFGVVGLFGLTIETGIIVALSSSGLYKTVQVLGSKR